MLYIMENVMFHFSVGTSEKEYRALAQTDIDDLIVFHHRLVQSFRWL